MEGFDHLLNWRLKAGSHPFPGKDGGTCITEVAMVVAGFPYRAIRAPEDLPDCFSRPICRLAMYLNDQAGDEERQRLLSFVTRLACADSPDIERIREAFIAQQMRGFHERISFDRGLRVLEEALTIGRRADPVAAREVRVRADEARSRALAPT